MTVPAALRLQGLGRAVRPERAARLRRARRGDGLRLGLRLRPPAALAARGRPRPGIHPVARRARRAHVADRDRHVGAHADVPLQPDRDRAGLRDARRDVPGPRDPGRRHRRGAQRGEPRHRVARPARALPAPQGGDRPHPAAVVGGAGQRSRARTTRRATSRSTTSSTQPVPIYIGAVGSRRDPARRPHRRRLHHDVGQGAEPLHRHAAARRCTRGSRRPDAPPTRSTRSWR